MNAIEALTHVKGSANRTHRADDPRTTFSHFGLIVDDVEAAQTRFDSLGVRIIKRAGELDLSGDTEQSKILGAMFGLTDLKSEKTQADIAQVLPALEILGFKAFMVAADPDGNVFEVQNQDPKGGI